MIEVRLAATTEVRPLQQAVLRPDGPVPGDTPAPPDSLHLGAFDGGQAVGAATLLPSAWPGPGLVSIPAWQLRSMAVRADRQGTGIGRQILGHAEQVARAHGAATIWAAARVSAVGFYEGAGWVAAGPEWDKPGVGTHRWMHKQLS